MTKSKNTRFSALISMLLAFVLVFTAAGITAFAATQLPPGISASDVGTTPGKWTSQDLIENKVKIGTLWYKIGDTSLSKAARAKSEEVPVEMKLMYHIVTGYETAPEPGAGDKQYASVTLQYPVAYLGGENYRGSAKNAFIVFADNYCLTEYKDQYSTATENVAGPSETKYAGSSLDVVNGKWTWWKNPRENNLPNYITGYINVQTKDPEHHKSVTNNNSLTLSVKGYQTTKNVKIEIPFSENVTPNVASLTVSADKSASLSPSNAQTLIRNASSYNSKTGIATIDLSKLTISNDYTYTIQIPISPSAKALQKAKSTGSTSITLPVINEAEGNEIGGVRLKFTYALGSKNVPFNKAELTNINVRNTDVTNASFEKVTIDEVLRDAKASKQGGFYFITYKANGKNYVLGATGSATTRRQLLGEEIDLGGGFSTDKISLKQYADLDHAYWEIMDAGNGKVVMGNLGARGWFGTMERGNVFFWMNVENGLNKMPEVTPDDYLTLEKIDSTTAYIVGQNSLASSAAPWYFTGASINGSPNSYSQAASTKSGAVPVSFYKLKTTPSQGNQGGQSSQNNGNVCKYCEQDHSDNFLLTLIHNILYIFAHLFGLK